MRLSVAYCSGRVVAQTVTKPGRCRSTSLLLAAALLLFAASTPAGAAAELSPAFHVSVNGRPGITNAVTTAVVMPGAEVEVKATGTASSADLVLQAVTVMNGYRTPWYNKDIDNTTVYSRHLYGARLISLSIRQATAV